MLRHVRCIQCKRDCGVSQSADTVKKCVLLEQNARVSCNYLVLEMRADCQMYVALLVIP